MKVICDRAALVESLNLTGAVAAVRTPKPALACIKLSAAKDGELSLAATDGEAALQLSTARVEIEEPGEILVPADKFTQIVRESADATLAIETDGDQTNITGEDSKFKIFGQPVDEFPEIDGLNGEPDYKISAEDLHLLVHTTIFATAKENSRYAINGVLFERDKNNLAVVATDGHRLALAKGTCKAKDEDKKSSIVPAKALQLLLKLFDDPQQDVHVKTLDNRILFANEQAVLSTTLVEGNFPPYLDVIPTDGDKKATLTTSTLISGVRRAALLTTEESKGVRMAFSEEGLVLSSRAPEMGEAQINVAIPEYQGEPVEIGFNPAYLLDALKVIEESQVQLEMKAGNKPGLIKVGTNFQYVIMPVNLQ